MGGSRNDRLPLASLNVITTFGTATVVAPRQDWGTETVAGAGLDIIDPIHSKGMMGATELCVSVTALGQAAFDDGVRSGGTDTVAEGFLHHEVLRSGSGTWRNQNVPERTGL